MYIKLGSTRLNYHRPRPDDFIILSQVVNSSMSYERPVLVRTIEELDIWFGREFENYDYFCELLISGNTLYLYRPVSNLTSNHGLDTLEEKIVNSLENIQEKEENVLYILESTSEVYIYDSSLDKFTLIPEEDLPQNQVSNNSLSLSNRDTLVILSSDGKKFISPHFYNDLSGRGENMFPNLGSLSVLYPEKIDYSRLSKNYQTLAFQLEFGNDFLSSISTGEYQYLIIDYYDFLSGEIKKKLYIFRNNVSPDKFQHLTDSVGGEENRVVNNINSLPEGFKNWKEYIIEQYKSLGYIKPTDQDILVSLGPIEVSYNYDIKGFSAIPLRELSSDIIGNNKDNVISFVSKTIGTAEEEFGGNIKVSISDLGSGEYRITITRFDYSEIFEGPLVGKDRLDFRISSESSLVYCYFGKNLNETLPEGSWYLLGGQKEEYTDTSYWKSLDTLVKCSEDIYPDYLLIPDIKNYTSRNIKDYTDIYINILKKTEDLDCQILVQCNDNWISTSDVSSLPTRGDKSIRYKLGDDYFLYDGNNYINITTDQRYLVTNDYLLNYINDKDNRLIYFYRTMMINGESRPGYYLYLSDLLNYDKYSPETNEIIYYGPERDYYVDETVEELSLIEKKCNYLIENNHIYYYKNYQNGESYNTTGWMRFCLGKIKRELTKNKWEIIDTKDISKIQNSIIKILGRISSKFSMIRTILIKNFTVSFNDKTIDLTIDTYISDLVNNNICIDLTINYNK